MLFHLIFYCQVRLSPCNSRNAQRNQFPTQPGNSTFASTFCLSPSFFLSLTTSHPHSTSEILLNWKLFLKSSCLSLISPLPTATRIHHPALPGIWDDPLGFCFSLFCCCLQFISWTTITNMRLHRPLLLLRNSIPRHLSVACDRCRQFGDPEFLLGDEESISLCTACVAESTMTGTILCPLTLNEPCDRLNISWRTGATG